MGGGGSSSSQRVVKGPYEKNVKIDNPQVGNLLSNLSSNMQSQLNSGQGDALQSSSQRTLQSLQNQTYNYRPNTYTNQLADSLRAQGQSQFNKDFAKAYSAMQGLGQGTSTAGLGNVYADYVTNTNNQVAQLYNDQYNKDIANILAASQLGLGQDATSKLGSLALAAGDLFKGEYGYTPQVVGDSDSWNFKIL